MAVADSEFSPQAAWKRVVADNDLGNPDTASANAGIITAQPNLPPPPLAAADASIAGDVVTVLGLIAAVILAILIRNSMLKAQVAKMKPYDAARNSALNCSPLPMLMGITL